MIIPVYNVKPYIEEALDSLIGQTYTNLEIILIDDGSNDGSGEICDQYAERDQRVRIYHQENKGLSIARNEGLDVASGEMIAFLDPDDAFQLDMIRTMVDVMKKTAADIAICGFERIRTSGLLITKKHKQKSTVNVLSRNEALRKVQDDSINTAVWNKLYKREIWEDLRFPEGHVHEGTYVIFDIFDKAEKIVVLNRKLIKHRIRPDSICQTISVKNKQDAQFSQSHFVEYIKKNTPEVFTPYDLQKAQSAKVTSMMARYTKFIVKRYEDKEGREEVKKLLVDVADSLNYCGMMIQAVYRIMLWNPYVGVVLFLPYCGFLKIRQWIENMK